MDKVVGKLKVMNSKGLSKSMEIKTTDTSVPISVLPMDLIQKLGLEEIDGANVKQHKRVNFEKGNNFYGFILNMQFNFVINGG